jgi:hypothetical protein
MTWHYILSKSPARANNINNLLDALELQLLKISQTAWSSLYYAGIVRCPRSRNKLEATDSFGALACLVAICAAALGNVLQIEGSGVSVLWRPSATFQGRRDGGGLNVGRARRITLALPNSARSAARSATNTPFPSAGSIIASCIATATRRLGGLRPMSIRPRSRSLALWRRSRNEGGVGPDDQSHLC